MIFRQVAHEDLGCASSLVGDIARPDLAVEKADGARGIFRSLHEQLLPLGGDVGVASIAGHLAGGMTSRREERRRTERIERLTVPDLRARARGLQILDVRERDEWDAGHIPDSLFTPYHDIRGFPEGVDPERPVAVVCASGQRAVVGASLLQRHGARHVLHVVDGGVGTWVRNGWPVVR